MNTKSVTKEAEYDELKERVSQLESLLAQFSGTPLPKNENDSVKPEDYVQIMSLTNDRLNLSTEGFGKGKKYTFTKFGEVKRIIYKEVADIIENQQHFLTRGLFFILDRRIIRLHGLDDLYATLLTKDKMESIIFGVGKSQDLVELYKSANDRQKEIINDMIVERITKNEDVDLICKSGGII